MTQYGLPRLPVNDMKMIKVSDEVHERLTSIKSSGVSYSKLINNLIDGVVPSTDIDGKTGDMILRQMTLIHERLDAIDQPPSPPSGTPDIEDCPF
jgi:hypothetical protein